MQRREFLKRSAVLSTLTASAVLADGEKDDYKPQSNFYVPRLYNEVWHKTSRR